MKKKLLALMIAVIAVSIFIPKGFAIELPLRIVCNGEKVVFPDTQPYIDSQGRTMVPSRFVGEELGAVVSWDGAKNEATFERGSDILVLCVGSEEYTINGAAKQMDTVAVNVEGRVIVPARYVAEAFGARVEWNDTIKTVYIMLDKPEVPVIKEGEEIVGGFVVPADTDVIVTTSYLNDMVEATFEINSLRCDYEKEKRDLKAMLLQKYEPELVDEIMDYINQKKDGFDELPGKGFYSAKQDQEIWIEESVFFDISILVFVKGIRV